MATKAERYPSKWLKASDLPAEGLTVVIEACEEEQVGEEKENKLVLRFKGGGKGLVCNATNWDIIAGWHGNDDGSWVGKKIKLYSAMVTFKGEQVPAVRVVPKPTVVPPPPEEDDYAPTGADLS
jgi:hypothetical protein